MDMPRIILRIANRANRSNPWLAAGATGRTVSSERQTRQIRRPPSNSVAETLLAYLGA